MEGYLPRVQEVQSRFPEITEREKERKKEERRKEEGKEKGEGIKV